MLPDFECHSNTNQIVVSPELARQVLSLMDLTSLNDEDTDEKINALCAQALASTPHVAAVCVYPQFVGLAVDMLAGSPVKIASVVNFPSGNDESETVFSTIAQVIQQGANEVDLVFPYERFLAGDKLGACDFISRCKKLCGENVLLKVILETGVLQDPVVIAEVSQAAILSGADFLKTSTGKVNVGATLEAAAVMLLAIKTSKRYIGFKASGGIRTLEQAGEYIALANSIMGASWVNAGTLRFGASQLLNECNALTSNNDK